MTSLRDSMRSATTPATSPKTVNGTKRQNASAPIARGEPESSSTSQASATFCIQVPASETICPAEEDPVVAVAPEAAERPRAQCEGERRHASSPRSRRSAGTAAVDRLEVGVIERAAAGRRARSCGVRGFGACSRSAVLGEPKADSAAILARAKALDEPCALEPVDVPRHRRRRDALLGGELGKRESGAALHEPEERRLPRGDAELLRLLAQLPCEPQEDRAELGRDCLGAKRNVANH